MQEREHLEDVAPERQIPFHEGPGESELSWSPEQATHRVGRAHLEHMAARGAEGRAVPELEPDRRRTSEEMDQQRFDRFRCTAAVRACSPRRRIPPCLVLGWPGP